MKCDLSEDSKMHTMTEIAGVPAARRWPAYNMIWRWHFYAGLFCIPFIIWLSITGALYLFKPQIEAVMESSYDHLAVTGTATSALAQVAAALAVVPGGVLNAYELPISPQAAVRVMVGHDAQLTRVYVHPETLQVLKVEQEDSRLMRILFRLHGELLMGDRGSMLVELAASWAIVLIITGLYMWWPRNASGLAGILYPRMRRGKHLFWRDLHAVTGWWIAIFTLFLLISGLPWAKSWGGMLKEVRHFAAGEVVKQDWTTGRSSELAERRDMNSPVSDASEHAGHSGHGGHGGMSEMGDMGGMPLKKIDYTPIDRLVGVVQSINLAYPVLISPPSKKSADWTARSDAQNRPLRVSLVLDSESGAIKSRKDFAGRPLLDRIIGIGVAAHEGQLFGWFNQALGVFTALGLLLVSVSGIVLWWKRRSPDKLGAPKASQGSPRMSFMLSAVIVTLGMLLPLLGISLLCVLLLEYAVLRRIPAVSSYLGFNESALKG